MRCLRTSSGTATPASPTLRIATIRDIVNRDCRFGEASRMAPERSTHGWSTRSGACRPAPQGTETLALAEDDGAVRASARLSQMS